MSYWVPSTSGPNCVKQHDYIQDRYSVVQRKWHKHCNNSTMFYYVVNPDLILRSCTFFLFFCVQFLVIAFWEGKITVFAKEIMMTFRVVAMKVLVMCSYSTVMASELA